MSEENDYFDDEFVVDDKKDGGTNTEKSDIEKFYDTTNSAQALFDSLP